MANIAAMGDAAQSVEQGISGAFTCVESCMKATLEMKHLAENEANKEADENAMKEQFVSAAMAQLKELAGDNFNIVIVYDFGDDTKGFDEADPPMPLIKVEYSPGQTALYRIYLFTKGTYERPEGHRWEDSDIQWWPRDGTQVHKPDGAIMIAEVMKLTFTERPGMTRAEREAKQNSLTLDKAVRDANTKITAQEAQEIANSANPEQTRKDIDARNATTKAGLTNVVSDQENDSDAGAVDPDAAEATLVNDTADTDDAQSDIHPADQDANPLEDATGDDAPDEEAIPTGENGEADARSQPDADPSEDSTGGEQGDTKNQNNDPDSESRPDVNENNQNDAKTQIQPDDNADTQSNAASPNGDQDGNVDDQHNDGQDNGQIEPDDSGAAEAADLNANATPQNQEDGPSSPTEENAQQEDDSMAEDTQDPEDNAQPGGKDPDETAQNHASEPPSPTGEPDEQEPDEPDEPAQNQGSEPASPVEQDVSEEPETQSEGANDPEELEKPEGEDPNAKPDGKEEDGEE